MGNLLCPGLLDTGPVVDGVAAIRDGWVNLFVVKAPGGLICIDTGWRRRQVIQGFERLGLRTADVVAVFITHRHWDHAGGVGLFPAAEIFVGGHGTPGRLVVTDTNVGRCSAPSRTARRTVLLSTSAPGTPTVRGQSVHLSAGPAGQSSAWAKDGQVVMIAGLRVQVIDTPGHTAGAVAYVVDGRLLFTGDTLRLKRGLVRAFSFWLNSDNKALRRSIRRLAALPGIECVLTAHSGISRDAGEAFARWSGGVDDGSRTENRS